MSKKKKKISGSRRAAAARVPGKPFKPGEDPRRSKFGPLTKLAATFALNFRNTLAASGSIEELCAKLWSEARRGRPWAIEMILNRLLGKVEDHIRMEGQISTEITASMIHQAQKQAIADLEALKPGSEQGKPKKEA